MRLINLNKSYTLTIMKKYFVLTLLFIICATSINAQNYRICGTNHMMKIASENEPNLLGLSELLRFQSDSILNSSTFEKNDEIYTIPVVVHVMHTGGSSNISIDQINDAMRIINEDYKKMNSDTSDVNVSFQSIIANTGVQFKLAQLDPEGNCTQGITRTFSTLTNEAGENVKDIIKWDPSMYLNIWVVSDIESGAGGYSFLPGSAPNDDGNAGIVILASQFGSIGASGGGNFSSRSLTHEIGHYLGLDHTWGSTNENYLEENCDFDDGISDTPNTIGSNQNCNTNQNTCGSLDNVHNFMDYSSCAKMYSEGQKSRMRSVLQTGQSWQAAPRNNLHTQENLIATGTDENFVVSACTPITEFKVNYTFGCVGDAFNFESQIYNTIIDESISYQWSFEGITSLSSSDENPSIIFTEPGLYSVTLTASNDAGSSSLTKSGYISVSDESLNMQYPYFQNFEVNSFPLFEDNPNANWTLFPTIDVSWNRTLLASSPNFTAIDNGLNSASFRIRSADFSQDGEKHVIVTPSIDLSNTSPPLRAYFDLAYARKNGNSLDNLVIYASDNCGRTWTKRFDKDTDQLSTNGGGNNFFDFIPNDSQWSEFNVNLNGFVGQPSVSLKFEFSGMQGNWLYIDNLVISETDQLSLEDEGISMINIYPNPSKGSAKIEFESKNINNVQIKIRNIYGAIIGEELYKSKVGKNNLMLDEMFPSLNAGIYFVALKQKNIERTLKIILTE